MFIQIASTFKDTISSTYSAPIMSTYQSLSGVNDNALYISLKLLIVMRGPPISCQGTTEVPQGLNGGLRLLVILEISKVLCYVQMTELSQPRSIFCNMGASTIIREGN